MGSIIIDVVYSFLELGFNIVLLTLIFGLLAYITDRGPQYLEVLKFLIYGPLEIAIDLVGDRVQYKQNHLRMVRLRN